MAGGEAIDCVYIEIVRCILKEMLKMRDFDNIQQALGLLEQVWEQRDTFKHAPEECYVDWRDIVDRREGGHLLT